MADITGQSGNMAEPLTEREQEILTYLVSGLSNHEIAARLHLAHRTVKWYNSQIYSKLGVENRERAVEQARVLGLLESPVIDRKHNLPVPVTPFVGRRAELGELAALLNDGKTRLVTLLAPGGMGKTRLALEAAEQILPRFANGVYFVELAPLSDPNNLVSVVASATEYPFQSDGRTPKQQLLDFFSAKSLLLVMDNFEHLLEGADLTSDILCAAPQVKILATSRERLNLQEEILFRIEGMDFPDWETPAEAMEYSAVKLFLQSARRVRPNFELQAEDLIDVARICRLVDGMPLGIVLAAAWVDALLLKEISEEISRNVDFLETQTRNIPERHRSILAVFDHTWNLLTEAERAVLMKLSVFRGGFTRAAAEAVAGANLRILISLMNKSLIRRAANSGHYDIHELTRQYAAGHLKDVGEDAATQRAHAAYFTDFMAERYLDIKGRRQVEALEEVEADFENVRMAWGWACKHVERAMIDRMVDGLYWYQDMRGQYRDGVANLLAAETALADAHDAVFHRVRARRLRHIVIPVQEFPFEDAEFFDSLEAARKRHDGEETAFCLFLLGALYRPRGLWADTLRYSEAAHQLYEELGDLFFASETLVFVSMALYSQGNSVDALPPAQRAIALKERINDISGLAWLLYNYAYYVAALRDYNEADKSIKRALEFVHQVRNIYGIILITNTLSWISLLKGDLIEAHAAATRALNLAKEKNHLHGITEAAANLGLVLAIMDEDPVKVEAVIQNFETSSVEFLLTEPTVGGLVELCLVLAALNSGDYESARDRFVPFQDRLIRLQLSGFPMVIVFAVKAVLDAHDGRLESAAEWLAVAFHYPYQGTAWLENWSLITRVRADLSTQLGEAIFDVAWEHGKTRNMETIVQDLVEEFRNNQ